MSREKASYRDTLEALDKYFPDRWALTMTDVADFVGVNRSTIRRWGIEFDPRTRRITKPDLARQLCQ